MRFLHLIKPVMGLLPEVAQPDRKVCGFHLSVLLRCCIASAAMVDEHITVAPESSTAHPLVSSSPFTSSVSWEPDGKPVSLALRHSANSFAQGDMSKTTIAESLGLERCALGWFVQFALRWPRRPQRKQIGDA